MRLRCKLQRQLSREFVIYEANYEVRWRSCLLVCQPACLSSCVPLCLSVSLSVFLRLCLSVCWKYLFFRREVQLVDRLRRVCKIKTRKHHLGFTSWRLHESITENIIKQRMCNGKRPGETSGVMSGEVKGQCMSPLSYVWCGWITSARILDTLKTKTCGVLAHYLGKNNHGCVQVSTFL